MAKLDFFTVHIEPEEIWINTNIELNFICTDHVTIIECEGIDDNTDLNHIVYYLKLLFENEINCTYEVNQSLEGFKHHIRIYGDKDAPDFKFECDAIKITEHD